MDYYVSTCTFVDSFTSTSTMFYSPTSLCTTYASTKCYSTILFSFDSSMNIGFTNVTLSFVCSLTHQCLLLLRKISTANLLVIYISRIIICAICIFSLYGFPSTHSENDDECNDDVTTLALGSQPRQGFARVRAKRKT